MGSFSFSDLEEITKFFQASYGSAPNLLYLALFQPNGWLLILDLITICTNNIFLNKGDISNTNKNKTQHGDSSAVGIMGSVINIVKNN